MKNFIILFLFVNVLCTAQTSINLDTIYANDHMNVALFFSEPIKQGIAGSNNFVFTYNREKEGYYFSRRKPAKIRCPAESIRRLFHDHHRVVQPAPAALPAGLEAGQAAPVAECQRFLTLSAMAMIWSALLP